MARGGGSQTKAPQYGYVADHAPRGDRKPSYKGDKKSSVSRATYSNIDDVKAKGFDKRGKPLLNVGGVPGYNKQEGTPGWIRKAADRAEGLTDKNDLDRMGARSGGGRLDQPTGASTHRDSASLDRAVGRPPYGRTAEVDPRKNTQGGSGKQAIKKGREAS